MGIKIIKGGPTHEESKVFAQLILMSAPYFHTLFGKRIEYTLESLFSLRYNLFSFEHVYIAEYNGELAGMLLGYDY